MSIGVVPSTSVPPGTAMLVAAPSAEEQREMEGMTIEELARYMVGRRKVVAVRTVGEQR